MLVLLLLKRDGKVRDRLHKIHKREFTAHNTGHFIFNIAQPDPFGLADCYAVFLNNKTTQVLLLNSTDVDLHMQLSHLL